MKSGLLTTRVCDFISSRTAYHALQTPPEDNYVQVLRLKANRWLGPTQKWTIQEKSTFARTGIDLSSGCQWLHPHLTSNPWADLAIYSPPTGPYVFPYRRVLGIWQLMNFQDRRILRSFLQASQSCNLAWLHPQLTSNLIGKDF